MLTKIYDYINDNEFRFTIYDDKIHIINYQKIISLEENYISFLTSNKKIIINGNNLSLKKILQNEILIKGEITNIEVINE